MYRFINGYVNANGIDPRARIIVRKLNCTKTIRAIRHKNAE